MKNTEPININKTLCIKKGTILNDMSVDYRYKCTSLGYHFGNINGGHYCSLCKVDDKFILYDDMNISLVDNEQINKVFESNRDAYMIVYTLE
jgi:ubiquitin C-terminal hydrolase